MPDIPALRRRPLRKIVPAAAVLLPAGFAVYFLAFADRSPTTFADREDLTIASVRRGEFVEYLSVTAEARPSQSVFVEIVEGGRVQEILAAAGDPVAAGQPILVLVNPALVEEAQLKDVLVRERQHDVNAQRYVGAQAEAEWDQRLLDQEARVEDLEQQRALAEELLSQNLKPRLEVEAARRTLEREKARLESFRRSRDAERAWRAERALQSEAGLEAIQIEKQRLLRRLADMTVRAPVAGHLASMDAEIGQTLQAGTSVARLDPGGAFTLVARADEYHLSRLRVGMEAKAILGTRDFPLILTRVSPEVRSGMSEIELDFTGSVPVEMRSGSAMVVRLDVGGESEALLLPRGAYYETTGGFWIFALDADGSTARRKTIRLGRQNPEVIEVLEGLAEGEQVIVSAYDMFRDRDVLSVRH